ncbi:hypothetical protein [Streptomyces sp. NPDC059651]|uniref:hypothetical protein n=1 Tax=Streptomyces sp. NPDC059651 TaxID=3346897 RepID=UPI00367EA0C8
MARRLVLAGRRRRPLAVTAVTVAAAGLWGPVLPLLVALFHLASRGRTWLAVAGAAVALITNALVDPALSLLTPRSYGPALLLALAVTLGLWAGNQAHKKRLFGFTDTRGARRYVIGRNEHAQDERLRGVVAGRTSPELQLHAPVDQSADPGSTGRTYHSEEKSACRTTSSCLR